MTNILSNPLYKIKGLPKFDEIKAEHVEHAFNALFAEELIIIEEIEQEIIPTYLLTTEENIQKFNYLFNNVVVKIENFSKEIDVPFIILQCLLANSPTNELRTAFADMQRQYTSHKLRISQSEKLYKINFCKIIIYLLHWQILIRELLLNQLKLLNYQELTLKKKIKINLMKYR